MRSFCLYCVYPQLPRLRRMTEIDANEGSASLCDLNGQLLFYTNGTTIWNESHDTMPNGKNVVGNGNFSSSSTAQGVAIVPVQGMLHKNYLFSLGCWECGSQFGKLYYSIIDMSLDGGLGDVDTANRGILLDSMLTEHMVTVAGNNCDMWLIVLSRRDSVFKAYHIDAGGINGNPVVSPALIPWKWDAIKAWPSGEILNYTYEQTRGYMDISPDRKKLAIAKSDVCLYDFDAGTGKISNPLLLIPGNAMAYGIAFSPGSTKLYVQNVRKDSSTSFELIQYDVSTSDSSTIVNSKTKISSLTSTFLSVNVGAIKRAPDGRIYCTRPGAGFGALSSLAVINQPDQPGINCQYDSAGFILAGGSRSTYGLPNTNTLFTIKKTANYRSFNDTIPCIGYYDLSALDTTGTSYLWNDGIKGHTRAINTPGRYWVRYLAVGTQCTEEFVDTFDIADIDRTYHYVSQRLPVCWTDSITLTARSTGGSDYVWDNKYRDSVRSVAVSGTYWVRYAVQNPACNVFVDSFVITDIPMQKKYTYAEKDVCWQDSAILFPSNLKGIKYKWNDETTANEKAVKELGYYSVSYYDTTACSYHLDSFYVFIPTEKYHASFSLEDSIVCQDYPVRVKNTSHQYYNQFTWFWGNGDSVYHHQPAYSYPDAGRYTITLVASHNAICNDTFWQNILVDTQQDVSFDVSPRSLCVGSRVDIHHHITDPSLKGLLWNYGDGNTMFTTDTRLQHAYERPGQLYISVEAIFRACPPGSYVDTVIVNPFPLVDLGTDSVLCIREQPVLLQNHYSDSIYYRNYWNTGDTSIVLKVLLPGRYTLTVTDPTSGCSSTESVEIVRNCYVNIPNVFTPNGDGINDYFFPRQLLSSGIKTFRMQIFNRLGQLIFQSENKEGRGWDGRSDGKEQPGGVYIYIIETDFSNGHREAFRGNVTLIR